MDTKLITRSLAVTFVAFSVAILFVVMFQPYGGTEKLKLLNTEVVGMLLTPWSGLLGALLRGMVSDNKEKEKS